MTNLEQAKITTLKGVQTFMGGNAAIYSGVPLIVTANANFNTAFADTLAKAAAADSDNKGYSEAKKIAKQNLAQTASALCGFAMLDWQTSKPELAAQCLDAESDYTAVSDSECGTAAQNMYELLANNPINPDNVSPADITNLLAVITTFNNTQGSSESVHATSPQLTVAFKAALAYSMKKTDDLKTAAKKVQLTQPEFYAQLLAVSKVSTVSIRHNHLHIIVRDKTTGNPLEGVVATFKGSVKTAASDANGSIAFDTFRAGDTTVTLTKTGYINYIAQLHIGTGKDTIFNADMMQN